jgi:hypothetical protein
VIARKGGGRGERRHDGRSQLDMRARENNYSSNQRICCDERDVCNTHISFSTDPTLNIFHETQKFFSVVLRSSINFNPFAATGANSILIGGRTRHDTHSHDPCSARDDIDYQTVRSFNSARRLFCAAIKPWTVS